MKLSYLSLVFFSLFSCKKDEEISPQSEETSISYFEITTSDSILNCEDEEICYFDDGFFCIESLIYLDTFVYDTFKIAGYSWKIESNCDFEFYTTTSTSWTVSPNMLFDKGSSIYTTDDGYYPRKFLALFDQAGNNIIANDKIGYLKIRKVVSGGYKYGWLLIEKKEKMLTLKNYAINNAINQSLLTGQIE